MTLTNPAIPNAVAITSASAAFPLNAPNVTVTLDSAIWPLMLSLTVTVAPAGRADTVAVVTIPEVIVVAAPALTLLYNLNVAVCGVASDPLSSSALNCANTVLVGIDFPPIALSSE